MGLQTVEKAFDEISIEAGEPIEAEKKDLIIVGLCLGKASSLSIVAVEAKRRMHELHLS